MPYNPQKHHRRSIRLKGYDYAQAGLYFLTLCCEQRISRFGYVCQGQMILNAYGIIAHNEWLKTPERRPHIELGAFIIMPNHMHGIIKINSRGELNSPQLAGNRGECNSPQPKIQTGECDSPQPDNRRGELNSPIHSVKKEHSIKEQGEFNSPQREDEQGECDSPQQEEDEGEFNSPRREDKNGYFNSPLRSPSNTVGAIVRGYKASVTKQMGLLGFDEQLWQRNYYEHIIRDERAYDNITAYILNNPAKWDADTIYQR